MRLHRLPWPTDVLEALGELETRLRVTLSFGFSMLAARGDLPTRAFSELLSSLWPSWTVMAFKNPQPSFPAAEAVALRKTCPTVFGAALHACLLVACFLGPAACSSGGSSGAGSEGGANSGGAGTSGDVGSGGHVAMGGTAGGAATAGTAAGGAATGGTAAGGAASGGSATGGTAAGGTAAGGTATGGKGLAEGGSAGRTSLGGDNAGGSSSGGSGGAGASGGGAGANGTGAYRCPSQTFPALQLPAGMPTRIAGAPPSDAFNNNGNNYSNVEGPVWIGNALYFSEIGNAANSPARIIKISDNDAVSVLVADSGSNGLAVDADGNIVSANQGLGGIVRINPTTGAKTTVIDSYNGKRFNGPNDLTIRRDGGIFFSDPGFQSPSPQPVTGVYFVPPGSNMAKLSLGLNNPNGVTLSLDEKTIYIGDGSGVLSYPVNADGTLGTGTLFGGITGSSDGMAIDCAGNLYVVRVDVHNVTVIDPSGKPVGTPITVPGNGQITNVAFGGADHKTLYITVMGTGTVRGVFKLTNMPIPGMPY